MPSPALPLLEVLTPAWTAVSSVHPALPPLILAAVTWGLLWLFRTYLPFVWQAIARVLGAAHFGGLWSKTIQAIPAALLGAALCVILEGADPAVAVKGALCGLLAAPWHETWKALTGRVSWLPTYRGGNYPAAGSAPPPPFPPPPPA